MYVFVEVSGAPGAPFENGGGLLAAAAVEEEADAEVSAGGGRAVQVAGESGELPVCRGEKEGNVSAAGVGDATDEEDDGNHGFSEGCLGGAPSPCILPFPNLPQRC